jgi:hypothetical protein
MSEYKDWNIRLAFSVQKGDTEGALTEAIFEAAVEAAPSDAHGLGARADTVEGRVWIDFTLVDASREFAEEVKTAMKQRIKDAVLSEDESCITAA